MARKKFVQNDNNLAICYYRYSSHAQNEQSIDQQRSAAELYAEKHGYKIVREYQDEAISGTTEERPGFQLMLAEVGRIKPAVLIIWKTDRLARDKAIITLAKRQIREAGCKIECIAEAIPDASTPEGALMEGLLDAMAEFYSKQLRQNVVRGLEHNARNALYNGHKMLGYKVDDTKHYVKDEDTSPVVQRIFHMYADGTPLVEIAESLNKQGIKTALGKKFTHNGLRSILKNKAYIGEYHYGDVIIPDGMPRLISDELFKQVQDRFERNKHKAVTPALPEDDLRYWLTGKLYCGLCGTTMHGMSGTGKHGERHYYYACKNHRHHHCSKKSINAQLIEDIVIDILKRFLQDEGNLASLAVDVADYYKKIHDDTGYLDSLKSSQAGVEKSINNLIKMIELGTISETIANRLQELEAQKSALAEAIEVEKVKQSLANDNHSIAAYFHKFRETDFSDSETRDTVFEYFIDKIYLYEDKVVIVWWYSDDKIEISLSDLSVAINYAEDTEIDNFAFF